MSSGQLTREQIARAEVDPKFRLKVIDPKVEMPVVKTKRGPRYTPVSRRQDRPNAVLWLLRSHPELKDSQIMRLVGTTKPTIAAIRDRSHWNSANLAPQDPVTLGLCSQVDLDAEVQKSAKRVVPVAEVAAVTHDRAGTLLPASETIPGLGPQPDFGATAPEAEAEPEVSDADEAERVFAKLKELSRPADPNE